MLARVRECRKLWWPVPRSHTSKLHFQDMTSSGSILVPFRCHVLRDLPLGSQCNGNIRTKVYRQIFSHHRVNFLCSEEPPGSGEDSAQGHVEKCDLLSETTLLPYFYDSVV